MVTRVFLDLCCFLVVIVLATGVVVVADLVMVVKLPSVDAEMTLCFVPPFVGLIRVDVMTLFLVGRYFFVVKVAVVLAEAAMLVTATVLAVVAHLETLVSVGLVVAPTCLSRVGVMTLFLFARYFLVMMGISRVAVVLVEAAVLVEEAVFAVVEDVVIVVVASVEAAGPISLVLLSTVLVEEEIFAVVADLVIVVVASVGAAGPICLAPLS